MSEGSDGEWYLRRCAEDEILAGQRSVLGDRADALIAVGMISTDTARRVIDLYRRARELRGLEERDWGQGMSTVPAVMPPPPRISACGRTIEQPWGTVTVHYVSSNSEQTSISVTIRGSANSAVPPAGQSHAGGPPSVTATDDRGRRHQTHFTGGGTDVDWQGFYVLSPPLPAAATWVRIFGERIELTERPADVTVAIEVLDQDNSVSARAERHLIRLAESGDRMHRVSAAFPVAAETLVDCGALAEAAELIGQVAMFSDALQGAPVQAALLPQRWRSVLVGRGRRGGPAGSRTIGVTTPSFDGIRVSVLGLRSGEDGFDIDFEAHGVSRPTLSSPGTPGFTVTAVDDREQHYLGEYRQFGQGSGGVSGSVAFSAPLDPSAENVSLHFTMTTARAVVRVPLRWDGTA